MSPLPQTRIPPELANVPLVVLHQDDHLLVFDKPAGLPSVPGRGESLQDCLSARAQAIWPDARVVHRLDMATSGVIVMARGADALRRLSLAFEQRRVRKHYEAVVAGTPAEAAGTVDLPLICDWPNRPRQIVDPVQGKPSRTHWQRLDRDGLPGTSRVRLEPVTGRTHQLRVHLLALGHPIVGDALYAPPEVLALSPRLLLHACRLELPHPGDGGMRVFEAGAPF
ncbi:RluA family pseudouridine synthase [Leptothrix discophora]|uniref:Dual-specificity RNA pseudouridine synthase RluA n=1 Tax=Leptothrix discophora TaxID=89 RepID=A0ABT9G0S3_LEPDI|nr:RluA family pseudouridine synthase [Leptothrix discophora]MDP4299912.1 RluA family pseudouridine synthase [Leptothrix discophora]